ncbi:T9SS type B sorting domain-containing protein [Carboxylicivirga sp. A043]|uniref:T9SS type B sorting domain-containing protein n=1 Tax=Carboxylicivirga litoralis TaxID=2816963 RepID=UPI0021CAE437|nr:T9SS type B sorting domain-containing protein [Carboxylicivirga sp. A043]MCU4154476.1 T9SS type B sorting domain-containing protein [Carboxylicivirga sp. A043]
MRRICIYLLLLTLYTTVNGQIGREFWFAAPDVWEGCGDEPVVLRVTTFDEAATITISLPAQGGKILGKQTVGAHSHYGFQLNKSDVENRPANQVNNKGILIRASADIAAYYDVSAVDNPDKFILKEDNALGFEFFIPSQNVYSNNSEYGGNANEKADIVASEDNTTVTITPSVDITGHSAGEPFDIILNQGQTYCIECRDISTSAALAGTQITADKRIAVTISDDAIIEDVDNFPNDLIGDQLIPVNVIGNEYVAINTSKAASSYKNQNSVQKVFVMAIEDNTLVFTNNTTKNTKALNKGEIAEFDISDHALFIYATKRVYAYQLTGLVNPNASTIANEIGSAILPSYSCNGSNSVSFTRVFNRDFWVNIIIKRKDVKNFSLYDNTGHDINVNKYINSWQTVPGQDTGQEAWVCCAVNLNNLSTGVPYRLVNSTGLFHLCILDESDSDITGGGASFGYFSSYNSFYASGAGDKCLGEEIQLEAKDGMKTYTWYSIETGNQVLSTDRIFTVTEPGKYWVESEVAFGGCVIADTLDVDFFFPEVELGNDTVVCEGEVIDYSLDDAYASYLWSNGDNDSETQFVADGTASELSVLVTDAMGCTNSDTVQVGIAPVPEISLSTTTVCEGEAVTNTSDFERYEWSFNGVVLNTDESQNWIRPTQSGTYSLTVWTAEGCSKTETIDITVVESPVLNLSDQAACEGSTATITAPSGFNSYSWSTGETTQSIDVTSSSTYTLEVTDENGCIATDDVDVSFHQPLTIDLGPDREECVGITISISNESNYSDFKWTFEPDNDPGTVVDLNPSPAYQYDIVNSTVDNSGRYRVEATDVNGCPVSDEIVFTFQTANPIDLIITEDLCVGNSVDVIASPGYDSYSWTIDGVARPEFDDQNQITNVSSEAVYEVVATAGTCQKRNEITVDEHELPTVTLPAQLALCDGDSRELNVESYHSPVSAALDYLYWNNDDTKRYGDWPTATYSVDAPGTYSVTVVDEFGCEASDQVDVGSVTSLNLELGQPQTVCDYETITLVNPEAANSQSYSWYQASSTGETLLIENTSYDVTNSGTYILRLIDNNGCEASDEVVVNVHPSPSVDLGDDISACGDVSLSITPSSLHDRYEWNDNPALDTHELLVTQSGNYKLKVWNNYGCVAEDNIAVTLSAAPQVDLPDNIACAGTEFTLTGPSGTYQYLWSTGETTQSITVTNGAYSLKVTDENGCVGTGEGSVMWRPVPKVDLGPDMIICPSELWVLDAGDGFASYDWHNGESTQLITANLMDTVNTVVVTDEFGCQGFDSQTVKHKVAAPLELLNDTAICSLETIWIDADAGFEQYEWSTGEVFPTIELQEEGTYWLRAYDGCIWATDTMQLIVHPTPVVAALDTTIYAQVIVLADGGTEPYQYAINEEDLQESNVFSNLSNGDYIFTVEDLNGCMAADTISMNNILDIAIPPVLTPNGDGYNDTWQIGGLERLPDTIIRIFDRYGKLLTEYYASDPPWDGKYLGKPVQSDAYWYVIQLMPVNKILKGHLTIKR